MGTQEEDRGKRRARYPKIWSPQDMAFTALPLFPLDLVLFPEEVIPLHIFEPRYRDLLTDCLREATPFGMVRMHEGKMEKTGCMARIRDVLRTHDDGSSDIMVIGDERFIIRDMFHVARYHTADVDVQADVVETIDPDERERLIAQHIKLLELAGRTPSPSIYENQPRVTYFIGRNSGLSTDQRQVLLEMRSEMERIRYLVGHLLDFIPAVERAETLRRKISSNGHFPDFPPD